MTRPYSHNRILISTRKNLFLSILLFLAVIPSIAQKTDKIKLTNGDVITGEVKYLQYGKLTYKTDDAGTLSINWDKITGINSTHVFEIMTRSGLIYFGSLSGSEVDGALNVAVGPASTELKLLDIVSIVPIKSRFFQRITGPISIGVGYTKENDLLQLTYGADLTYRYRKIYSDLSADGQFTLQYDTNKTKRQSYNINTGKFLRKRLFIGGLGGVEQNSALDLKLRGLLGLVFGKTFIQSNINNLRSFVALQATRESYFNDEPSTNNIELVLDIDFKRFLYHSPKSEISTSLALYPNLTNWGRVRGQFNVNLNQELVKDFFLNVNLYANYDNKPSESTSGKLDWGIMTSLGYTL